MYNLMKALVKKSQSLWRYEENLKESADCPECQELWNKLKAEDSADLELLKKATMAHLKKMGEM